MDWLLQVQTAHSLLQRACSTSQEKATYVVHSFSLTSLLRTTWQQLWVIGHRLHQGLWGGGWGAGHSTDPSAVLSEGSPKEKKATNASQPSPLHQ